MEQNSLAAALCMTTLAGLSTGLGGLLVLWRLPGKKLLARSLGFAAGVMLAVSLGGFYGIHFYPLIRYGSCSIF